MQPDVEGCRLRELFFMQENDRISECHAELRQRFKESGPRSEASIGLAFSGGGIRAACFDTGILWQLAKQNRLKDVVHLSVCSGGSYAGTAWVNTLCKISVPNHNDLDQFYRDAVWMLISRFQENVGFLASFNPSTFCRKPQDGSFPFPRWVDIILFALNILGIFLITPVMLVVYIISPLALTLDFLVGAEMRKRYCAKYFPGAFEQSMFEELYVNMARWGPLIVTLVLAVLCLVLRNVCPKRPPDYSLWLSMRSLTVICTRSVLITCLFYFIIVLCIEAQDFEYPSKVEQCMRYVSDLNNNFQVCKQPFKLPAQYSFCF